MKPVLLALPIISCSLDGPKIGRFKEGFIIGSLGPYTHLTSTRQPNYN